MKKKKIYITISILIAVIVIAIPTGFIYVLSNGNPYTKYIANKYVPKYLEEKGYTDEKIEKSHYVEPKYLINKDFYHGHFMVIFKDEPNTAYYYGITKKGKQVQQFCEKDVLSADGVTDIFEDETKYSEKECKNSLDNRDL
ncbi:hypothetical protein B1B04_12400 [Lysinibacillus sp. KCTC 33748]|uniref:DUF3139 domain-containing protein n=1 Tax=unclassified Lysinibacillus TaxID=2636778 RepID=UPI0009A604BE|nr:MULTISPECIES: DUF3139 domain-containing protein [unclassified Lysinibacillus]OXS73519.1 hypothetical protein B1B04_12400 [Lysinibacillus sp. KCTC 33748]SKB79288.1 Protein of unknown function [Lysinibacillus sp. AC-3]